MGLRQAKYAGDAGWLTRVTMARFYAALGAMLQHVQAESVFDAGCGEGEIMRRFLHGRYAHVTGADLDPERLALAADARTGEAPRLFRGNLEAIPLPANAVDLVLCLEVLEHVGRPEAALRELHRVTRRYALLSVPNEPFWRMANMLRGAYWADWGNTPEHINHWSVWGFRRFVRPYFDVIATQTPVTWSMLLLEKRPAHV